MGIFLSKKLDEKTGGHSTSAQVKAQFICGHIPFRYILVLFLELGNKLPALSLLATERPSSRLLLTPASSSSKARKVSGERESESEAGCRESLSQFFITAGGDKAITAED